MPIETCLDDIQPIDLGLPVRYTEFRSIQREFVQYAIHGPNGTGAKRFVGAGLGTGTGKTLASEALRSVLDCRMVVLNETKSLMTQRLDDLPGMVCDIRGRSNYQCSQVQIRAKGHAPRFGNCEEGDDYGCKLAGTARCEYGGFLDAANRGDSVSTNYSYWMAARGSGAGALESKRPIDLLVLEEAHLSVEALARFMQTYISVNDLCTYARLKTQQMPWSTLHTDRGRMDGTWMALLQVVETNAVRELEDIKAQYDSVREAKNDPAYRHLDKLVKSLGKLTRHGADGNWLWKMTRNGVVFDCIWPGIYSQRYLFSGVPKVVMISATLRPKLFGLHNLNRLDVDFWEWPRQFPLVNSPVYFWPIAKLNKDDKDQSSEKLRAIVGTIDQIIAARPGRKVLIHTVSYARAEMLQSMSRYGRSMILNRGQYNTEEAVERFKTAVCDKDNVVALVGPSFTTGWDFKDSFCEVNIIMKVPWPDISDPVIKARMDDDEHYPLYVGMQEIVQAAGRGTRHETDRSECVAPETRILTDDLQWIPAGDLREGDRLLAFDELPDGKGAGARRYRWSHVIKAKTWTMPRVRVIYDDGEMITTPNHPWLVHGKHKSIVWVTSDKLQPGNRLFRFMNPWKAPSTYDEGWLAGFYDGEGCLALRQGKRNPNVGTISISQRFDSTALSYAKYYHDQVGFDYRITKSTPVQEHVHVTGGLTEVLRMLGQVRPKRLIEKFVNYPRNERIMAKKYSQVIRVEKLDPGPITSLQTTTKTYIAEGMGAHNTFILDAGFSYFYYRAKEHAPRSFVVWTIKEMPKEPPKL